MGEQLDNQHKLQAKIQFTITAQNKLTWAYLVKVKSVS